MAFFRSVQAGDSRLRIVFNDAVVSSGLANDATLEDIARVLVTLAPHHHGHPIAIDVTLAGTALPDRSCNGGGSAAPGLPGRRPG